jgi:hypothetical protein
MYCIANTMAVGDDEGDKKSLGVETRTTLQPKLRIMLS